MRHSTPSATRATLLSLGNRGSRSENEAVVLKRCAQLKTELLFVLDSYLAAAVPKQSPYKRILSRKLLKLIEGGALDLILSRWERGGILNCGATGELDTSLVESLGYGRCENKSRFSAFKINLRSSRETCQLVHTTA